MNRFAENLPDALAQPLRKAESRRIGRHFRPIGAQLQPLFTGGGCLQALPRVHVQPRQQRLQQTHLTGNIARCLVAVRFSPLLKK